METIAVEFIKAIFSSQTVQTAVDKQCGCSHEKVLSAIISGLKPTLPVQETMKPEHAEKPKKEKAAKSKLTTATASTSSNLDKMTIVMLKEKCKNLGIKPVGNKQALINKIIEQTNAAKNIKQEANEEEDVMIVKDNQGLYVHTQTGLIFDPNAKVVVAYKDEDDNVLPLDAEHVEVCHQYGFEYRIDED